MLNLAPTGASFAQDLGTTLKMARTRRRVTQMSLCAVANISQSHLSKIERGKHIPTIDTFVLICRGLNLNPGAVLNIVLWGR